MSPLPRQQSTSSSADSADEMSLHPAEETSDSSSDAASVETATTTDPEETAGAEFDNGREAPRSSSATGGASAEPSGGRAADNEGRPSPSGGGERKRGGGMDGAVEFGTRSSGGRTAEDRRDRDEEEKKDGAADDEEDADDFRLPSPTPSPSSRAGTPGVNPGSPSTLPSTSTPAAGTPTFSDRSGTEHPIPDNKSDGDTRESRENVTRPISRDDDEEVGGENTAWPITSEGPFHEEGYESREDVTGPIISEGEFHDAPPATNGTNQSDGRTKNGGTKREPTREGTRTSSTTSNPSSTMTSSRHGEGTDPANTETCYLVDSSDDVDTADGKSEAARHATHDAGAHRRPGGGQEVEEVGDHNPADAETAANASASSAAAAVADRPDPPARSSSILVEEEQPAVAVGLPIGCYSSGYLDEEGSQRQQQDSSVGESDSLEEAKAEEDDAGGDSPLTGKVRTATFSEPVSSVAGDDQSETRAEGTGAMSSTEVLMMTMSPPETPAVPKTLVLSSPSPEPSSEDGPVEPEGSVAAVDPKPHAHDERSNDPIGSVVPGSVLDEAQTVETASTLDAPQPAAAVPALLPSAMTNDDRQRSISFSAAHEVMPPPPAPADPVAPMVAAAAPSPTMQRSFVGGAATMVPHPQQLQPQLQPQPVVQIPAHLQHQHQQLMQQPQMQPQMQQPQMAIQHQHQQHAQQNDPSPQRQQRALSRGLSLQQSFMTAASAAPPGRRKIHFRLMEEEHQPHPHHQSHLETTRATGSTRKLFQKIRRRIRSNSIGDAATGVRALRGYGSSENLRTLQHRQNSSATDDSHNSQHNNSASNGGLIYRGTLVVSWYDGTGCAELQEHVLNSASRKLGLTDSSRMTLEDVRIIDDAVEPHEEIVLCPYIPDGSQFVLKFRIKNNTQRAAAMAHRPPSPPPPPLDSSISSTNRYARQESVYSRAPESPSAAPSPFPSVANLEQLQMLLEKAQQDAARGASAKKEAGASSAISPSLDDDAVAEPSLPPLPLRTGKDEDKGGRDASDDKGDAARVGDSAAEPVTKEEPQQQQPTPASESKKASKELSPDELVLKRLNQLNELLTEGNIKHRRRRKEEKKQVVFVLANYFVLFLSLIAISAEVHTRAPIWMEWLNSHLDSVQSCSEDKDSLYQCVSEGNFSGLVAAFVFWITRSAATKNVLLFGFDSPQKLWTVVYEAGVSAVCWGCSYMFIRRGLNPDTRPNFLHKYWKDAVYGSLAGFNAAFMKAVLKNLLPQDQVLDVLESRQLRIVDWVSHIFMTRDT